MINFLKEAPKAIVEFLRKENWVAALIVVAIGAGILLRNDTKEDKEDWQKLYFALVAEKQVDDLAHKKEVEVLVAENKKFQSDLLEQYRKDKELNDAVIREAILIKTEQQKEFNRLHKNQEINANEAKKIERKIDGL